MTLSKCYWFYPFLLLFISCAYYNTLFNAENSYKSATQELKNSKDGKVSTAIRKEYQTAIDKCWKLINIYGDSSKYADDALLLIGKSHYQVEEYTKSERFLNQFIQRYPNSNLLPEAKLWYAKSLIELEKDNEALTTLKSIFDNKVDDKIAAMAYFAMGDLYRIQEIYDQAIGSYKKCLEISGDDILSANALFSIGEIYYELKEYTQSIENFSQIRDYDAPIKSDFDAQMYKVAAYTSLAQYEQIIELLQSMLRESRYMDYFSIIDATLGDTYKKQKEYDFASRQYNYVLETYPKSEGSAQAAFGLAELMEYYYQEIDSAKNLYFRVSKEYRLSELNDSALVRGKMLENYLKIRANIKRDFEDLQKFSEGDELVAMEEEEEQVMVIDTTDTTAMATAADSALEKLRMARMLTSQVKPPAPQKMRTQEEVEESLEKNRFGLAEFFLLTMQNYDSAEVAYINFISTTQDTILKPKAYHGLYYIYSYQWGDSSKADSLEKIILDQYPNSVYAKQIRAQHGLASEEEDQTDHYHLLYLRAESFLFAENFDDAIDLYSQIALEDSGSTWAEKSRYAIAWIYENKLNDVPKAVDAYNAIVQEYPNTEIAKIASNKVKEPPQEKEQSVEEEVAGQDSTSIEMKNGSAPLEKENPQENKDNTP